MSVLLIKTLQLILSLCLLILVHELGHYTFARLFKTRVNKFYLFFNWNFSLLRWDPRHHRLDICQPNPEDPKPEEQASTPENDDDGGSSWRDTIYGIGWIPLGGYCSIAGMVDETTNAKDLASEAKSWEFRAKPAWQRLFIMLGGVLFNFLTAIVIYSGIVYAYGEQYIPFVEATEGMNYCDSAHKIGFVDGDIPLKADGNDLDYYNANSMQAILIAKTVTVLRNKHDTVTIAIPDKYLFTAEEDAKNGQPFMSYRLPVVIAQLQPNMGATKAGLAEGDHLIAVDSVPTPEYGSFTSELLKHKDQTVALTYERDGKQHTVDAYIDGAGKLGIMLTEPTKIYKTIVKNYGLLQSIPRGLKMSWDKLVSYVSQLKLIFTAEGAQSLGGFGTIGSIFPERWSWLTFWEITAFLSIILAVMNILPIPILDGGYVLFLLIEMLTGWKPSERVMDLALKIGFTFLVVLLLYANLNDIYRFIIKTP